MEITERRTHEVRYYMRSVEFTGRPSEEYVSYTNKGKSWIPDRASTRHNHGEPITDITVDGFLLKKDGTPSLNRVSNRYITPHHRSWGRSLRRPAPAWLLELFNIATN